MLSIGLNCTWKWYSWCNKKFLIDWLIDSWLRWWPPDIRPHPTRWHGHRQSTICGLCGGCHSMEAQLVQDWDNLVWFSDSSWYLLHEVISIASDTIRPVDNVRNLGVIFDSALSFQTARVVVARTCYYQIRQIRTVRKSLTQDSCHTLNRTLVFSRLDYCNSLLAGAPKVLLDQLSCVMRASATDWLLVSQI